MLAECLLSTQSGHYGGVATSYPDWLAKLIHERNIYAFSPLTQALPCRSDAALGEVAHWHHLPHHRAIGKRENAIDPAVPFLGYTDHARDYRPKKPFSLHGCAFKVAVEHEAKLIALVSAFHPFPTLAECPLSTIADITSW
jgi:hypothetical protein